MPNGYNPSNFPTNFNDPAYAAADQAASSAVGLPPGMLTAIRVKGEKSNADQISSANAATPWQITPPTRQAIIDQTGVDPYLNPQTAAYGAAYLLKQNLDRSGGNPVTAVAEYHGGTDPANWGPKTLAYTKRVTGFTPNSYQPGTTPNPFQVQPLPDIGAAPGSVGQSAGVSQGGGDYQVQPLPNIGSGPGATNSGPSPLEQAYQAYKSGQMSPQDKAQFEQDVDAGRVVLPGNMSVSAPAQPVQSPAAQANPAIMPMVPQAAVDAFNKGQMSPEDAAQFQKDVQSNAIALPPNASLTPPVPGGLGQTAGVAARGYIEGLGQGVGQMFDKAKGIIDAPVNAVSAIMTGQNPLQAVDSALGTHLAPGMKPTANLSSLITGQAPQVQSPVAGAPNAAAVIPSAQESATPIANNLGLPVAQTPTQQIVQEGARGAGLLTQPFPGLTLARLPAAVAAGAAGGAVGEQVHQATGNQALGLAANLLTTVLSPLAASRVMSALTREISQEGSAGLRNATTQSATAAPTDATAAEAPTAQAAEVAPQVTAPVQGAQAAEATGAPTKFGAAPAQSQGTRPAGFSFDENGNPVISPSGSSATSAPVAAANPLAEDTTAATSPAAPSGSYVIDNAINADGPEQVRVINHPSGAAAILTSDGRLIDISAMKKAGFSDEKAIATAMGDHPQGTEADLSKVRAAGATAAENAATPAADEAAENASAMNPVASPLQSAARDFLPSDELAAQARKAAGQSPLGIGKTSAQETLAGQFAPDPERLAAAERLGIADNLQPDHLTTNQAAIEMMQAIKSMPGSAARQEEVEGLQQVGNRAQKLVEQAGGTPDLSDLSAQVKSQLMSTQQQLDQKAESLYEGLKSDVPPKTPAPATQLLSFIQQRADELGGADNLSPMERRIAAQLAPKEQPIVMNGQRVQPSEIGMAPQFQQPSYALLDDVRKSIGNGLKNAGIFKDEDMGLKKKLYGLASEDQKSALASSGVPDALPRFEAARSAVQMRKSVEDDLTSLFGKQLGDSLVGKLGTAMKALPGGDESQFVKLMKAIPPSMRQQVTASGLGYAFGKATKNGELNFKTYADWMDGLKKNSAAFSAVMSNLPQETRTQLLDLAKVSRGISNATRENISTGRIMAAKEQLNAHADGLLSKVMNTARQAAVSHLGTGVSAGAAAVAGPIGAGISHAIMSALSKGKPDIMKAADALIVSPEFQALAKGSQVSDETLRAAANSSKFRKFYNLAQNVAANDPNAREHWLRGLMSATGQETNANKR